MTGSVVTGQTPDEADWSAAQTLLRRHPTKYGSLNWVASRPLIAAVNDVISRASGGLVSDLRHQWVDRQPRFRDGERVVDVSETSSWVVAGDVGQQDGSQYVVCRALSDAGRGSGLPEGVERPGFLVVMSDVIYPAGDVDDYRYAVYHPYRLADLAPAADDGPEVDDFTFRQPIYALPGNHDWYDGLSGFMYHFADEQPLALDAYVPTDRSLLHRLFRILWRRPGLAGDETREAHGASPLTRGGPDQPGPYYAIQTAHVLLVCIDTGIDGTVDPEQFAWLKRVSARPGAKVLLTGKPLVVDRAIHPTPVTGDPDRSVWELVHDADNRYVATAGGDIHNFQLYPRYRDEGAGVGPERDDLPFAHIVSGGGGAYMHATHVHHTIASERVDDRRPGPRVYPAPPTMTFPNTPQSLRFFASRLIGGVSRAVLNLSVMTGTLFVGAALEEWSPWPADLVPWTVGLGLVLLLVAVLVRVRSHTAERTARLPRAVVTWIGSPAVGLLAIGLTYQLDPSHAGTYVLVAAALTVLQSAFSAGARETRWWVRRNQTLDDPQPWLFWPGLTGLCVVLAVGQVGLLDPGHHLGWLAPACVVLGVGVAGWVLRRRPAVRWQPRSGRLAIVLQLGVTLLIVWQVAALVGRPDAYLPAIVGGVVGTAVIGLATGVGVLVVCQVLTLVLRPSHASWASAWGRAAALTWHLVGAVAVAATLGWGHLCAGDPLPVLGRPSLGLPAALVTVVSVLFVVDRLRRSWPRGYARVVIPAAVALTLGVLGAWQRLWWVPVVIAALVIVLGLLVGATLVHLSFLGAYRLALPSYRAIVRAGTSDAALQELMPDEAVFDVFTAREAVRQLEHPAEHRQLLFWIRMTAPGVSQPGGLLQRLVSELFSTDQPPFYKSFLTFASQAEGARTTLAITLHEVFGDRPSTTTRVCTLTWEPAGPRRLSISGTLAADPFA